MPDLIWYASYGTNMARARLACYLEGGTPSGASLGCPGARDPAPPRATRAVVLAGSVYFAWESSTWGGGVAFLDPSGAGTSAGVAYLLTAAQFSDVAAQEMHRPPGVDLDLGDLLATGTWTFGSGRYETMHVVGRIDDDPVVTFTAIWDGAVPYRAPAAAYLATMGRGLVEGQGWDVDTAAAYLVERPGIGPDWDAASVADLLRPR